MKTIERTEILYKWELEEHIKKNKDILEFTDSDVAEYYFFFVEKFSATLPGWMKKVGQVRQRVNELIKLDSEIIAGKIREMERLGTGYLVIHAEYEELLPSSAGTSYKTIRLVRFYYDFDDAEKRKQMNADEE